MKSQLRLALVMLGLAIILAVGCFIYIQLL